MSKIQGVFEFQRSAESLFNFIQEFSTSIRMNWKKITKGTATQSKTRFMYASATVR